MMMSTLQCMEKLQVDVHGTHTKKRSKKGSLLIIIIIIVAMQVQPVHTLS